jgi:hypothetical protein
MRARNRVLQRSMTRTAPERLLKQALARGGYVLIKKAGRNSAFSRYQIIDAMTSCVVAGPGFTLDLGAVARLILEVPPTRFISDLDIRRAADLLIREHGDNAELEAAKRADEMFDRGDDEGGRCGNGSGRRSKRCERHQTRGHDVGA